VVANRIEFDRLKSQRKQLDRSLMITRSLAKPRDVRILPRGNWMDETGPIVEPAVPAFLGSVGAKSRPSRADLARWLVTPVAAGGAGEFTARVTANRIWSLLFGGGLCRSAGDLGGQGELPDHPELLDRLALEFVQQGWDVRKLIRTIVTSRTYRMASDAPDDLFARDPDNRLLARQGRWRLPAEGVRDTALFAGGLLVEQLGGASVHPYQPAGYYRHLNFPQREYRADTDSRQWRRGLYVHWQRMFLHPQLLAFDAPAREECTAARMRSNTPKAALVLLNDPTFLEAARKLAERAVTGGGGSDDERITFLWKNTLSRLPAAEELALVKGLLDRRRAEFKANPKAATQLREGDPRLVVPGAEHELPGGEVTECLGQSGGGLGLCQAVATDRRSHGSIEHENAVLHSAAAVRLAGTDLVFPGAGGALMSDMTMRKVLTRAKEPFTVHGFRSSFRDWVAEKTAFPREVAEAALAHTNPNEVEAAYQRGSMVEKRRRLMDAWGAYCSNGGAAKVVRFSAGNS
jgi:hypothetical protein